MPPTIAPPADGGDNAAASVWTPNNTAPMMTSQDVLQVLQNEQVPTIVIGDAQIPLSAGSLPHMVWALVNLLLAVAGVVLAGVMVIRKVVRKKRQDGDEPAAEDENGADKHKKRRLAGLMLAVTAGVLGVLLFIFTEDTSLLMVLVDNWTLWQLVVFVVEIVGCVLTAKRRNKEQRAPGELRELRE